MRRVVVIGATRVTADREAQDAEGGFGAQIAALRPDVVIDLICFTPAPAAQLVDALPPSRPLLVHCGTIWVHGPARRVPVTEDEPRTAYGAYGPSTRPSGGPSWPSRCRTVQAARDREMDGPPGPDVPSEPWPLRPPRLPPMTLSGQTPTGT
jgi:hypothetical protein